MPSFGKRSKANMKGIHPDLVKILNEAIKRYDFSVLCGLRTIEEQKTLVAEGKSQTMNSKHLTGDAVDLAPYPVVWGDVDKFKDLALIVLEIASQMGIGIRYGGNWKSFKDYPHFELKSSSKLPSGPTDEEINQKLSQVED